MRKKLRSIIRVNYITIALLLSLFLSNILITHEVASAQDENKLDIKPLDGYTVDADKSFYVKVTDGDANPVSGAKVAIQNYGDTAETKEDGRALLTAPPNEWSGNEFIIIANKSGYKDGQETMILNKKQGFWESLIQSPYFPIFIASICLVVIILYVNNRQKKSIFNRAKKITDDKALEKYDATVKIYPPETEKYAKEPTYYSKEGVRVKQESDPKVEEIRISRPNKEKEIVPVKAEEDKTEKVMQKKDYDWFEGTDEMRYEIEKLTGDIDEEGMDKWFEGVDDLKLKVKQKVKKKGKNSN